MEKFGDHYALDAGRSGHARLRMISEIHDGNTRLLLQRAGLRAGHRYVEFGCGLGYVTRWAGQQGATATGIDLSEDQIAVATELIEEPGQGPAEFRTGSIYEPGLEAESVDIAYCRWLLVHLERPADALRAVYAALKPGGAMVCEEADVSAVYTDPRCDSYEQTRDFVLRVGRNRQVDYAGGRRAHLWALEAGFQIEHLDAYQPHYVAGPYKSFWNWTFQEGCSNLVKAGEMGPVHLERLAAGMTATDRTPHIAVAHARMHQLIARKPRN